jgi:phosphohistidine swiveling domain-containing protein
MGEPAPLACRLHGTGVPIELAGGKGASLDRLIAAGAPVPACGILTTDAYRAFTDGSSLGDELRALVDGPLPAAGDEARARDEIDDRFLAAPMPAAVAAAIEALVADVADGARVAVRSSATAEDLGSVSFAGQYRSFLDIEPAEVARAVRLTWASLWHPAPRAYRRFHGVDEAGLTMAVIVMRMLDPDVAGVAFTRDPGGSRDIDGHDQVRVELVHGLGEALVSGAVTPDVFLASRAGDDPALALVAPALAALPALSVDIEQRFGVPQDIEWAVVGDRLWLLQARPITTAGTRPADDGFDVHAPNAELTTAGIAEMLPGVLPPRLWALDSWVVEESFRRLFARLGGDVAPLDGPHALLARYRGRAAVDLDRMRAAVASIPGGSPAEMEQQYFGDATSQPPLAGARSGIRQGLRALQARASAAEESEVVVRIVELLLDDEPDPATLDDDTLVAFTARLDHLAARVTAAEVAVAAMATASYRAVESLLGRHLDELGGERPSDVAQRITGHRGAPRNALSAVLAPLAAAVRAEQPTADLRERFDAAVRRAGSRAVFAGPTWEESPDEAWRMFRALVEQPFAARLGEPERRSARVVIEDRIHHEPRWRATRRLSGQLVDARRAFVRREADDAAELLDRRERTKAAVLMLGGMRRRVGLEVGRRLVARGRLADPLDIELLTTAESAASLCGRTHLAPATVATRRRWLRTATEEGPLPRRFRGAPPPAIRPITGTVFRGWGASAGRYEGTPHVADSSSTAGLRRGDVLVAKTTDASWVPVFLLAGAIVVEEGGPLSHAAIVARELGIPAVVNVPGIVERLAGETGDVQVTVDGTTGEVAIHAVETAREPAAGVVPPRDPLTGLDAAAERAAGFHVFVTGLIGVGASLSILIALTESIASPRGLARLQRRSTPVARMAAVGVRDGFDAAATSPIGLHPRRWYALVASLLLLGAAAFGARSTIAYWAADASDTRALLAWAAAVMSATGLAAAGAVVAAAAHRWPAVPAVVRRLTVDRSAPPRPAEWLGRRGIATVATLLPVVAVLGVLVTVELPPIDRFDRWLYGRLDAGAGADRWAPDWLNQLGRPATAIALAVAFALLTWRCRVLSPAIPAAIVATGLTVLTLTWLTMRARPELGGHAGEQNSYVGGHVAQLTLFFGFLPLVLHVVTGRRWVRAVARVGATSLLAVLLMDTVRTGGHWPTDQLGGVLLATAVLVIVHARYASTALHDGCRSCPVHSHALDERTHR